MLLYIYILYILYFVNIYIFFLNIHLFLLILFFPIDMYGYHGKRCLDFLRITMAMPRLIAPAKRLLEQGFKFAHFPIQGYQSYEANIDFEIRYVLVSIYAV